MKVLKVMILFNIGITMKALTRVIRLTKAHAAPVQMIN